MKNIKINKKTDDIKINYVVGIGASAGGLEAINELIDNMPATTGFSFVIVQHLSPDYKSLMGELLAKHTEMQVLEAEENMLLQPNCIYLIPTGKIITVKNGLLKLVAKTRDHLPNTAIDAFLESLAKDKGEKAIAIILSGTGTDGTKGIEAVKNAGGTIIVQDPATAQFDGMPNSAIATGYADLILSPDMMAEELLEFIDEAPLLRSFTALSNQEEAILLDILELVYKTTAHDFSNYKRPTINRRLSKRMAERNIKSLYDYYNYLLTHPDEIKKLCREFLLHVTKFFRDEEAFTHLKAVMLKDILQQKERGDTVKVWTVACSTGEEAYSLAMLFDECLEELQRHDVEVKIFATDISQDVIEVASKGFYSDDHISAITPERLRKYFIKEIGGYRVTPTLRKMIVFAKHDITKDPPFSKIDLLTCRNMLIYMNPLLQKNILQKFHFALNDNGFLFLGSSENISVLKDVMNEVDKKWKIYKCVSKAKVAYLESFSNPSEKTLLNIPAITVKSKNALNNLSEIFKETLLEEYDYAGIYIDRDFEVKQAIGNFKKFIDFPETSFNFNLLKMVPPDLSIALSTSIRKAMKDNERVVQRNVKVQVANIERSITIIVKPYLAQKAYMQPFVFIVLKEEAAQVKKLPSATFTKAEYTNERIDELEQEIRETKENLQTLVEEVESANEELQSSNEEIISSNEELQSTNEELQSLNEELHTVNAEHQLKIKELIELNDDLNNYFRNSDIGQIMVDRNLLIRKFTPAATRQVNLIATDIGRSIVDISNNIQNLNFINDIKSVMQSKVPVEKEILVDNERNFQMRIAPYLRQNKTIDGVVINFIDVTEIRKLSSILEAVFDSSTSGILAMRAIRDGQGVINDFEYLSANSTSLQLLGEDALKGRKYSDIYKQTDPTVFEKYANVVNTGNTENFEIWSEKRKCWFDIVGVKMQDGLVVTFSDISEKKVSSEQIARGYEDLKETTNQLQTVNYKLEQSNLDLLQFASVASHDLKEPLRKVQAFGNLLRERTAEKMDKVETNYLDKMINSSNRMQVLIDDILTLSRLSNYDAPHAKIDVNGIIKEILDDLEINIREKSAKVNVGLLPAIHGVPGQVRQLFQNLITNAIKFNEGKPLITIAEETVTPELAQQFDIVANDYNGIYIQDNGIGFDEMYSDKIFGIFQRLEKSNFSGTGIGLAIVKKIVDNHKGFIKAQSKPGEGARFVLLLPK